MTIRLIWSQNCSFNSYGISHWWKTHTPTHTHTHTHIYIYIRLHFINLFNNKIILKYVWYLLSAVNWTLNIPSHFCTLRTPFLYPAFNLNRIIRWVRCKNRTRTHGKLNNLTFPRSNMVCNLPHARDKCRKWRPSNFQTCLALGEEIIKYCLKLSGRNGRHCAPDETSAAAVRILASVNCLELKCGF